MPNLSHTYYKHITLRQMPNNMEQTTPKARQTALQRRLPQTSETHTRHRHCLLDLRRRQTPQRPIHGRSPDTSRHTQPTSSSPQIMQQQKRKQTHTTPIDTIKMNNNQYTVTRRIRIAPNESKQQT